MGDDGYRNPAPTVDIIIEVGEGIVLIERDHEPFGWALPGGFVDYGETVEQAAVREAAEETHLDVALRELFYVYSDPRRDPRKHTMSTVFIATASGQPVADDDARDARIFSADELPEDLVFDHNRILAHYLAYRRTGKRPLPADELAHYDAELK